MALSYLGLGLGLGLGLVSIQGLHDLVFADPGADYIRTLKIPLLSVFYYNG